MAQSQSHTTEAFLPNTTADTLAARLRTRMFDGSFAPGEAISIRQIAKEEGISVIPARDALRGLVAEGALEFRDSRTIAVPEISPATADEIAYARVAIEGELAGRAFPALADKLGELNAIDVLVTAAIEARDVPGYIRENRNFHFAIYRAAAAPALLDLAERLWLLYGPSMRIVCEVLGGQLPGIDYHRKAIGALAMDDAKAFRAAIEADIAQGMTLIRDHAVTRAANGALEGPGKEET